MERTLVHRKQFRLMVALLLAVGMLFAAVGPVFAETTDEPEVEDPISAEADTEGEEEVDVDPIDVNPEAIDRLKEAGLVEGRAVGDDVDFALDQTITRAELLTVLVRAVGGKEEAEAYDGESAFPDVDAAQWYSGWVAVGAELSHEPLGYPDGTFGPDRKVTAAEAVTFAMKFLGIDKSDEGEWPNDWLQGFVDAGLADEGALAALKLIANEEAPRGIVFTLLDKAFDGYEVEEGKNVYDVLAEAAAAAEAEGEDEDEEEEEENGDGDEDTPA